ncbi:type IX secretion system sortase PorU [Algoriphagus mannitolivorans]|uniref:type IX secretion system sortase PorU n=1 Tax=Algoriphagus mannitolivorans TaxID=226504 RepID=UPI000414D4D0|nr:type IX secretion system sortase PorU [Algoriphagus mannitolivorans]
MKVSAWLVWFACGLGLLNSERASAQFFETKITESKIYRLSLSDARKLGFNDLSQVSFFGYPGMLPQKLDSSQLQLQEIPAFIKGENLYVFLQGPHSIDWKENESPKYIHHHYEDTLSYLIGKSSNPKRLQSGFSGTANIPNNPVLFRFFTHKEEKTNLLNSGKTWYSNPIRQGQSLNLNLGLKTQSDHPWLVSGEVMSQATTSSSIRILTGDQLLHEVQFSPLPNTTYGLKGDARTFNFDFLPNGKQLSQLRFTFQGNSSGGFLDYVLVGVPYYRNEWENGVFESEKIQEIPIPTDRMVWEVSDFFQPKRWEGTSGNGKKWAIFFENSIPSLSIYGTKNLGLRLNSKKSELLIIAPPQLLFSASKLQSHKESLGVSCEVVNLQDIYNSFGYGNSDLSAIRNFIAWKYHASKTLKNVLILGKGTFDYKGILGGRPNLVPVYASRNSLNPLTTYSSDDYFAQIDWGQGEWVESREGDEKLQIGIGRIPVINGLEAGIVIDKIIRYETVPSFGAWKRNLTFIADDGDNNIHLRDAESLSKYLNENHPDFLIQKQYLDRFEQLTSGSSQSSPQANAELQKALEKGTLLLNFIGHGNETTLTAEEIFSVADLKDWPEMDLLPIWMTATCEFGRFDSPFLRSAAEELLIAKNKGAIALLSTGRPVFSSVNFTLNNAFIQNAFLRDSDRYLDLGTIYKNTKNNSQNGPFNRNFSLLGDPSLRLPLPELRIEILDLKTAGGSKSDTLRANQEVVLRAEIRDPISNSMIAGFEGEYLIEIFGKPETQMTLGNESNPVSFSEESNRIFKGKGEVKGGTLESRFWVGKNIDLDLGEGRIRIVAKSSNNSFEAMGVKATTVGGENPSPDSDQVGPEIQLKLNLQDPPFLFHSRSVQMELKLNDQSGVNASSFNPNQLLSYQINEDSPVFLGDLYVAENGNFKSGYLSTRIEGLKEGFNTLTIRAWDNLGNGSVYQVPVEIRGSDQIRILSHKVFPNPSSDIANFELTHNRPGETLLLKIDLYSLGGEILFSESFRYVKTLEKIENLTWNFFQGQTKYPAKGTYIYKLTLLTETDFTSDQVSGKLVIE